MTKCCNTLGCVIKVRGSLEKRLYTVPYGKQLLSNLPDFVRMVDVPMPEFETKGRELDLV